MKTKCKTVMAFANALLIFGIPVLAQEYPRENDKIVFTEIVDVDSSKTAEEIYAVIKEWIISDKASFSRGNTEEYGKSVARTMMGVESARTTDVDLLYKNSDPLKLDTKSRLIARSVYKYTGTATGCVRYLYIDYSLKAFIKDGRYKIEISDFSYSHFNMVNMKPIAIWGGKPNCTEKGSLEELTQCDRCNKGLENFHSSFISDIHSLVATMKKAVSDNLLKSDEDNW